MLVFGVRQARAAAGIVRITRAPYIARQYVRLTQHNRSGNRLRVTRQRVHGYQCDVALSLDVA